MRIIAGCWRSRRLVAAAGDATRPTADRVREALFSMLESRIGGFQDLVVLDLFAGSGALALEALSRGAAQAFLVEQNAEARGAIAANIRALGARAQLIARDARRLPPAPQPADIVFLDPPYRKGLARPALVSAREQGWIAPHSWLALEQAEDESFAGESFAGEGFAVERSRAIGKARLLLLRPEPAPPKD